MNQLIQELKQQAGIDYNPDQEGLDQFAELIVRECMDVVANCRGTIKMDHWLAIKEHFGVEQ